MDRKQAGISVIELPLIALMLVFLSLAVVKINHSLSLKAKLDRLSYSLVSVVASDALGIPLGGEDDVIQSELSLALLDIAERHFYPLSNQGDTRVGVYLEQLKFAKNSRIPTLHEYAAGANCLPESSLRTLSALSPVGNTPELNLGRRADLFQVTVCLVSVKPIKGELFGTPLRNLSQSFYRSSSVLIGRQDGWFLPKP